MELILWIAYGVLAVVAIVQAFLLALQTWEHRRYARSCMRELKKLHPRGRVAVFAPCKGLDVELEGNLCALMAQDYPEFEVSFVVEAIDDPACKIIRRVMAAYPHVASRLVVAGHAIESGQKVHNLRVATSQLSADIEYLAFLDSDSRPRREWLRILVARFSEQRLGAVTGYRWFVPSRPTLANHALYSLNCDVMTLLGRSSYYLVWGGSWAIRRDVFDQIGLRDAWKGTLSDDLVASQLLREARMPVRFEPAGVVASPVNQGWPEVMSFVRRQYMVGRYYVPHWWVFALVGATFTNLIWAAHAVFAAWGLLGGPIPAGLPFAVIAGLAALGAYRGKVRQDLVATYFPERAEQLRTARAFDIWLNPLGGLLNWLGVVSSVFGRHITWRGISYRVLNGGKIRAMQRLDAAPEVISFPALESTVVTNNRNLAELKAAG
ncbi:MAG: glycosyltransferase [Patescibacteria group bacterium]|nr:glycosyltransferase [Patescibacteria group bacterium]